MKFFIFLPVFYITFTLHDISIYISKKKLKNFVYKNKKRILILMENINQRNSCKSVKGYIYNSIRYNWCLSNYK